MRCQTSEPTGRTAPPALLVRCELEELPVAVVVAGSFEDEHRLRAWLAMPATRRRVLDAVQDVLDELDVGRRAA